MPRRHSAAPRPAGFTLIELLVVVAILAAASLLAFGVFAEDRSQIRYDDTRQRLQILRRAILGQNGPSTAGAAAAGFVADNGALPTDLLTLTQTGSLLGRAVRSPVFDPKPDDTSCAADGSADDITLLEAGAQLVKGHAGDYLGGLVFNGRFRDGWGNVASTDDAANFGWQTVYDDSSKQLSITSLGNDNAPGPTNSNDFAADTGLTVNAADWLVPIAGWTVRVSNARTGTAVANDIPAGKLSLSLLVFVNVNGGKWLRYATTSLPCLDGNGDGEVGGLACARSVDIAFTDGCKPGESASNKGRIPAGRHLLVLTDNGPDGQPWTADDKLSGSLTLTGSSALFTQVDVVAGRNLPASSLDIR